jgi:hypothetical protein
MRRRSRRIPLQPVVTMPIRGVLPKLLIVTPTRKHPKATKELPESALVNLNIPGMFRLRAASPRVSPLNMTEGKSTDSPKETDLFGNPVYSLTNFYAPTLPPASQGLKDLAQTIPEAAPISNISNGLLL